MLAGLVATTNAIYLATDRRTLLKAMESGLSHFGFEGFLLFCHKTNKPEMIQDATLTNYSSEFLADYEQFGWSDSDFPLDQILQSRKPLRWNTRNLHARDSAKQSYVDFLHASRLRTGILTPLKHRPGTASALGIACYRGIPTQARMIQAAAVIGNAAMTKAEILGLCPEISVDAALAAGRLSPTQVEVMNWIAEGRSNPDIATIMGLTEDGVRYHVAEILRKLGVASPLQAAAIHRGTNLHSSFRRILH